MWAIDNQTPFAVDRSFVRDRDGAEIWLVAVRATFDIAPSGKCTLAKIQDDVALTPQYHGEPGKSPLRCDMDLPRTKLGTDVIVNGTAYAPGGIPVSRVEVTLRVAEIEKTLVVHGRRHWQQGLVGVSVSEAETFEKCALRYERACGGPWRPELSKKQAAWSAANPIGRGLDMTDGRPAPRIEYPDQPVAETGTRPAGFGAIACDWMPRQALAGTYDDQWQKTRQPLVPSDFRDEYFFSAPSDQQLSKFLKGGEPVELVNLTPGGSLRFSLPSVSLGFTTLIDSGQTHHVADLHTVLIEPDHLRLVMVWHTALPCHHALYTLKETVVFEKQRASTGHTQQVAQTS